MKTYRGQQLAERDRAPREPRRNGGSAALQWRGLVLQILLLLNNQQINFHETVETDAGRTSYQ